MAPDSEIWCRSRRPLWLGLISHGAKVESQLEKRWWQQSAPVVKFPKVQSNMIAEKAWCLVHLFRWSMPALSERGLPVAGHNVSCSLVALGSLFSSWAGYSDVKGRPQIIV